MPDDLMNFDQFLKDFKRAFAATQQSASETVENNDQRIKSSLEIVAQENFNIHLLKMKHQLEILEDKTSSLVIALKKRRNEIDEKKRKDLLLYCLYRLLILERYHLDYGCDSEYVELKELFSNNLFPKLPQSDKNFRQWSRVGIYLEVCLTGYRRQFEDYLMTYNFYLWTFSQLPPLNLPTHSFFQKVSVLFDEQVRQCSTWLHQKKGFIEGLSTSMGGSHFYLLRFALSRLFLLRAAMTLIFSAVHTFFPSKIEKGNQVSASRISNVDFLQQDYHTTLGQRGRFELDKRGSMFVKDMSLALVNYVTETQKFSFVTSLYWSAGVLAVAVVFNFGHLLSSYLKYRKKRYSFCAETSIPEVIKAEQINVLESNWQKESWGIALQISALSLLIVAFAIPTAAPAIPIARYVAGIVAMALYSATDAFQAFAEKCALVNQMEKAGKNDLQIYQAKRNAGLKFLFKFIAYSTIPIALISLCAISLAATMSLLLLGAAGYLAYSFKYGCFFSSSTKEGKKVAEIEPEQWQGYSPAA